MNATLAGAARVVPWLLLPVALSACSPNPARWLQPNYDSLPDSCFTDEFATWMLDLQAQDGSRGHPTWSDPCIQALEEDIGLDRASCAESTADDAETGGCSAELAGLYLLATLGLGTVDGLDQGIADYHDSYVHEPFKDAVRLTADTLGHDAVGPALYDMVTSTITAVVVNTDRRANPEGFQAWVDIETREMTVADPTPSREEMVAYYVHEMGHLWTDTAHVDCSDLITLWGYGQDLPGWTVCDADWNGAYGFTAGGLSLAVEYGPAGHDVDVDELAGQAVWARCHVNGESCPEEAVVTP